MGTAGSLRKAIKSLDQYFLSNGDTLLNFNPLNLKKIIDKNTLLSVATIKINKKDNRYGGLKFKKDSNVEFTTKNSNYINAGYYFINKKLIYKIKNNQFNFEKDFLINIKKKLFKGIKLDKKYNFFRYRDTKRFKFSRKFFKKILF